MNLLKKSLFAFLVICLSSSGWAKSSLKVNLCYHEFREEMVTAVLYTAKDKNFFVEDGLEVSWIKNDSESFATYKNMGKNSNLNLASARPYYVNSVGEIGVLQKAREKKCDFISTTFESILAANIDIKDYAPVAVYRYGRDYDTHLVVRRDSDIQTIKDLKGKNVRFNQIGTLLPFEAALKKAGLSSSDIHYQNANLETLLADLDAKKIDAVLSYNPTIPLLLGSNRVRILEKNLFAGFYAVPVPHSILLVKREVMVQQQALYRAFMHAFSKAAKDLSSKPENMVNAVPEVKKFYTPTQIEKSLAFISLGQPLLATEMKPKTLFTDSHFVDYANVLKDHGFIAKAVDLSSWKE